ncbi:hypothetical protein NX059_001595 [Plenodomus lindquistii]|nr:hypothetical protein NX059_001595 [Plenodomus lindquistii]
MASYIMPKAPGSYPESESESDFEVSSERGRSSDLPCDEFENTLKNVPKVVANTDEAKQFIKSGQFMEFYNTLDGTAWLKSVSHGSIITTAFEWYISFVPLTFDISHPGSLPGMDHIVSIFQADFPWVPAAMIVKQFTLALKHRLCDEAVKGNFEVGITLKTRWTVTSQLTGVAGSFNRGIYVVKDEQSGASRIMKLLPPDIIYDGYARREIAILSRMNHPNIVQCYGHYQGASTFEPPWIVTEYCKYGTLQNLLKKQIARKTPLSEKLMWQIFESLVRAVHYCQHGPTNDFDGGESTDAKWDPVYHRDIIPSNILYTPGENDAGNYTFKLADFGCAVSESELRAGLLTVDNLPLEDPRFIPPEGPVPSEAADVYQIGLAMLCFIENQWNPWHFHGEPMQKSISKELLNLVNSCADDCHTSRPTTVELLHRIQVAHTTTVSQQG